MLASRKIRYLVLIIVAALLAAAAPSEPVEAFKLRYHEQLLRDSLTSAGVGEQTITEIIGSFHGGTGSLGSDAHQADADAYRHFDNARNLAEVCALANAAWGRFYREIRDVVSPRGAPEYTAVFYVEDARSSFGALTHALQDFYAHSNWIELFVEAGQSPSLAEPLFPSCTAAALEANLPVLPPGRILQTGYFDLAYGFAGCPKRGEWWVPPVAGFLYCHETLNKDSPDELEGRAIVPGYGITYHALAMQLARAHTTKLLYVVLSALRSDWSSKFPDVRAECLIEQVFRSTDGQPCRYARLDLINDSHDVRLGAGSVDVIDQSGRTVATKSLPSSGWPAQRINVPVCLPGTRVGWEFAVIPNDVAPPIQRTVRGSSVLPAGSCDAALHINPKAQLTYLVSFTNRDTVISLYSDVIVVVNDGQRLVSGGPVPIGGSILFSLGPCSSVLNLNFIIRLNSPVDGTPREVITDPPPFDADPDCMDIYRWGDIGGNWPRP